MSRKMKYALIAGVVLIVLISGVTALLKKDKLPSFNYDDVDMVQLNSPEQGQEIAIIDTTLGTFKIALYREYAPETVKRFVDLANQGYYDGKYIFGVKKEQFFLAGTTNANGVIVKKDESNYENEMTKTEIEVNKNLWPLKGAIISFGPDYMGNGVFFAGLDSMEFTEKFIKKLKSQENANSEIINAFIEKGGMPYMSGNYTVFAQSYNFV